MRTLCIVLAFVVATTSAALFEDQAFKFDWRQQLIGVPADVTFYSSRTKDLVVVRSESNVLAAIDADNGKVVWRQVFPEDEVLADFKLNAKSLTTLSFVSKANDEAAENSIVSFIRTWNLVNGAMSSEKRLKSDVKQNVNFGFLSETGSTANLVHVTEQNGLKIVSLSSDSEQKFSFSTGATSDKEGFSCLTTSDSLVCASTMMSMVYSTKLPLEGNSMSAASLTSLGLKGKPLAKQKLTMLDRQAGKVQLQMEDGSVAILTFKTGKFSSVNSVKAKSGKRLVAANCPASGDLIILEQPCAAHGCHANAGPEMSITKGSKQITYTAAGDRGFVSQAWIHCEAEDPDAFQMLVKSQDGSLVSVTPLGNIMWQREEGLSKIKAVQLIAKGLDDDDGTYEEKENEVITDVLELFMKRIRHHASQIQTLLFSRIKSVRDIAFMFMGNSDSLYDDFGIRKVIVAVTATGKIYGIDSKSGKVIWHKMFDFADDEEEEVHLFLTRSAAHFMHDPSCALIYRGRTSSKLEVVKFNPLNGKDQSEVRQVTSAKLTKAMLLHHHSQDDYVRPILMLTEGKNFEVEPANGAGHLREVSGKMYIASVDADKNGIHGHRVTVDDNGQLQLNPIWSFASPGAKILYLIPKSTDEVVHSHGRVMADRSVLFKYLNPNLAFVLAEGRDSGSKTFINVYLLDLVTGRVIFSATHKRVQGPYHIVHSENWAVYTYYNEKSRRAELGSLELFEGKTQSNSTVFSSLHNNVSPLVERQSYILGPSYVTALTDTLTEKGITTKHLLMATATGSIFDIPRHFLDPRRPSVNTPPEMREPGLPPYVPELVFPPEAILNYNQTIRRTRGIVTAPSGLESTSVVFAYGLDIYCTRVTPSKGFDLLKDDFDHYVIASVLVGLTAAAYITRKLSQRKNLKSAWK